MRKVPTVAIVGRPNVGKSALFNRIARKEVSIVHDRAGVTRDRVIRLCRTGNKLFDLIDTGGLGLEDGSGFQQAIEREVDLAVEAAEVILFVVDALAGVTPLDEEIARRLRRSKKSCYLVVNKVDTDRQAGLENEFYRLGFDRVWPVSATHGRGISDLMRHISRTWSEENEDVKPEAQVGRTAVSVVGKPNVGKSSLVNALLRKDRVIVSPVPGTTRDAVDVEFSLAGRNYLLIDTAGLRKRSRVRDPLEQAMGSKTAHAINRADICLLVVDAVEGPGEQEKKIAGLIQKAYKACIVVVNKWDLTLKANLEAEQLKDFERRYAQALHETLFFIPWAPVVFVSAQTRKLGRLVRMLGVVDAARRTRFPTGPLNRLVNRAMEAHPPPRRERRSLKLLYLTQHGAEATIPTLVGFVNDTSLVTSDYERYLEMVIRREYPCTGAPIRWLWKGRKNFTRQTSET